MKKRVLKSILPLVLTAFVVSNVLSSSVFAATVTPTFTPSDPNNLKVVESDCSASISTDEAIIKSGGNYVTTPAAVKGEFRMGEDIQKAKLQVSGSAIISDYTSEKEVVFLIDTSGALAVNDIDSKPPTAYGLFSGSEKEPFALENYKLFINGDIHSNDHIEDKSGQLHVLSGVCESFNPHDIKNVGSTNYGGRSEEDIFKDHTAKKDIPSLDFVVDSTKSKDYKIIDVLAEDPSLEKSRIKFAVGGLDAIQIGNQMFNTTDPSGSNTTNQSIDPDIPVTGFDGVYLEYTKDNSGEQDIKNKGMGTFAIKGNKKFVVKDKQTYSFDGNVIFASDSIEFEGSGRIAATGDILIKGNGFKSNVGTSSLIYSKGGNIVIDPSLGNNGKATIDAIIYAPSGKAEIRTGGVTVNGSIVADKVRIAAGDVAINLVNNQELQKEISSIYKVSYLDTAKASIDAFRNYATSITHSAIKVGIIQYNETANDNDFNLYNTSTQAVQIKTILDGLTEPDNGRKPSNLGDGLRRAYELLTDYGKSSHDAAKYVVVISGATPSAWTMATKDSGMTGNAEKIGYYRDARIADSAILVDKESYDYDNTNTTVSNSAINIAKTYIAKINSLKVPNPKDPEINTSFIAICQKPPSKDQNGKPTPQRIYDLFNMLNDNIKNAFAKTNNTKPYETKTGDKLMDDAFKPISNVIKNDISDVYLSSAAITFKLPHSKLDYFQTIALPEVGFTGECNLAGTTEAAIGIVVKKGTEDDTKLDRDYIINEIMGSDNANNSEKFNFSIHDIYVPLKYIPSVLPKNPTSDEISDDVPLEAKAELTITYKAKVPSGNLELRTKKILVDNINSVVKVIDKVDIN